MLSSIDTYLKQEIEDRLQVILSNCYIIDEALKDVDKEARENFKKTYVGESSLREVRVFYGVPQNKEGFDACYAVLIGQSVEDRKSIGGVEGNYNSRQGNVVSEVVSPSLSDLGDKIIFKVSHPIAEFEGAPELSFSKSDNLQVVGDTIQINNSGDNEFLLNSQYTIYYTVKDTDEDVAGISKGYTATDELSVVSMSINYDTARCLDIILRLILITMRESIDEKFSYSLQTLAFDSLAPVITDGDTTVFGRTATIQYTVSHSVDFDFYRKVTELIVRNRRLDQ